MLHIVNGDSVAEKLKQGVVHGDILVWREIYSEGPVFLNPAEPSNRLIRAENLEKTLGIRCEEFIAGCASQEQRLARFKEHDEVVLWFEHDLFDQTMLSFLLNWFSKQSLDGIRLNLVCIGTFPGIDSFLGLGQLSVQQLETLVGTWRLIGQEELEIGKKAWEAYTSPDPHKIVEFLQEDTFALPFVQEAFEFHLSRFPSLYNGLGKVEQTTLALLHNSPAYAGELFHQAGAQEHWYGMGDLQYWRILKKMCQGSYPLIQVEDTSLPLSCHNDTSKFHNSCFSLTDIGRRIFAGEGDWIAMGGIDQWLGGVHLQGHRIPWRWDGQQKTLVAVD